MKQPGRNVPWGIGEWKHKRNRGVLQLPVRILAFLPVFGSKIVGKTDQYKTALKGLIMQKELPSNNIKW